LKKSDSRFGSAEIDLEKTDDHAQRAAGRSLRSKIALVAIFGEYQLGTLHRIDEVPISKMANASCVSESSIDHLRGVGRLRGPGGIMALSAWLEQAGSRPTGRPQQAEKSREAIACPETPGPTKLVQIHPLLAETVDQILDWDVADGDVARAITPKTLPSTTPVLIAQYRVPMRSDRHFGSTGYRHRQYGHVVTALRTGVVTARPSGPLGVLLVRLKPETAARLLGDRMQDFINEKIDLSTLFNAGEVSLLEEMLMEAPDSATRFARIESFLLRNLRQRQPDCAVSRAAQYLRRYPALRVRKLAARLDVGERHLSRSFRALFGASPKQFARVARVEKVFAMRQAGSAWADIAYACGFADQAHMINDFDAIVGETPQQFFRPTAVGDAPVGQIAGPDFFGG
jgi:AraC-like DNA-binding protein